ncbi:phosphoribosyltransferase [Sulfurovum sp. zt1-1]|uniref:Phosphoribosyltransferase n=1 Tax=Sulfurovum zhangzhouensis TaxID=3019067 RepID=A0ABT7QYQ2_9BACT|nr:phosphoribosyltransferase [Sulfurovum zhangzhouensis]MDM5271927.1 phosphoribosyltransferase [Sulfurovum zhangzhouensis]
MFKDRKDAGKTLVDKLQHYKDTDALILAIPRGGVELGYEVAKSLHCELSMLICRKLPYPHNPESGFGAIAEDGSVFIYEAATGNLSDEEIEHIKQAQQQEIKRRIAVLRGGKPLPSLKDRTVILIDDGIAMGSTMRAAVQMCRNIGTAKIVIAVPVAGARSISEFSKIVDELIVLESPINFRAVAQVYENWYDVSDEEVLALMRQFEKKE